MTIRTFALASVASAAVLAGSAQAADRPVYAAAPLFTWTGFYVGANVGYGAGRFSHSVLGEICTFDCQPFSGRASASSSGVLGGLQAGYNWQFAERFVIGLETDYQWTSGNARANWADDFGIGGYTASLRSQITNFGTVRARLGYTVDRALIYVTGGWAYGTVKTSGSFEFCSIDGCQFDAISRKLNLSSGWVIGAGLEYALTQNLSLKGEYLYVDLGGKRLHANVYDFGKSGGAARINTNAKLHVVRAGLNYRFGGAASPVVARY
jgi:outer membrane immunogenic protein